MNIRRAIQWVLLAVWVAAIWGSASWFFTYGGYITAYHLSFFVAGLGLGLVAKSLLAGEQDQLHDYRATVLQPNGVREEVKA